MRLLFFLTLKLKKIMKKPFYHFPSLNAEIKKLLLTINIALIIVFLNFLQLNATEVPEDQQSQITGKVTDSNTGEPLIGATVVIKGTTVGALTSNEGTYSINVSDKSSILVFSYVGYTTQELSVSGRSTIDVALVSEVTGLDEVVVIGYGTTKKATLTGAVSAISSKDLSVKSVDNISTQLAGKLPGLRVISRTGQPGDYTAHYDIRGLGTPLIVIDGVVRTSDDFVRLNPTDIEQISIIKDASAAVYGVKAANGVVLITTKGGEIGKPKISLNGSYSLSQMVHLPRQMNAYEFALITTQNEINHGRAPNATTYSQEDLDRFKSGEYPSTDWFDLCVNTVVPKYNGNINIEGGSDRIRYYTSFGYLYQKGIWKSNIMNYSRYNLRSNVSGKITDNLQSELRLEAYADNQSRPTTHSGATGESLFVPIWIHALPTIPVYANNNPDYLGESIDGLNPMGLINPDVAGVLKTFNKSFSGQYTLNYNAPFLKGLSGRATFGYDMRDRWNRNWRKEFKMYTYDPVNEVYTNTMTKNAPTRLQAVWTSYEKFTTIAQVNYNTTLFNNHSLRTSLIYEDRYEKADNLTASKEFAIQLDQFYAGITNPLVSSSTGGVYSNDNQSIIGRINYDIGSKYLLEFGFNYNGSSRFPKGQRWGFFPYTSLGWRLSEESFFKNALPFVTNFKLRGSWGLMGDDGASSFQFITGYNYPSGNYIFNDMAISGLGFRGLPNLNITWYTANTKNIGLDLDIKNGLINFSVDIFRRDRSGLLATRSLIIPESVGAALAQENLNSDMRQGIEIVLGQTRTVGKIYYNISANFSYSRGKRTYIERTPDAHSYNNWRNNTTNRWDNIQWGYVYIGQFQSQEDLNTSPDQDGYGNRTLLPGDLKYEDVNKDGQITGGDQVPIGRGSVPDINFGLNGSISYKNFDLSLLLQGSTNYNHMRWSILRGPLAWNRNSWTDFLDNWHHEDLYDANSPWVPGKYPPASTRGVPPSNQNNSKFWMDNPTYLRLKNIEIGYTLKDQPFMSRIGIDNLRAYFSGFNVFTLTRMENVDPEILGDYSYPMSRDFTFGLNVTF